jgi:hypothetical protein
MSLLFDISPDEVPDKKKPRKRAAAAEVPAEPPREPVRYFEQVILGQSDGHYVCYKPSCQATYFDIIDDYKGQWIIECAFCGWQQRVPAIEGVLAPSTDFVFFDGRFNGMTLAQAADQENGLAFIKWCAKNHKSESVKDSCLSWLSAIGYSPTQR